MSKFVKKMMCKVGMLKNSHKVAIHNLESTVSQNFNGSKKILLRMHAILFNPKVLYYRKIVIGNPKFKLGIQMLGRKPTYAANCTKSAGICATKFSKFLGEATF